MRRMGYNSKHCWTGRNDLLMLFTSTGQVKDGFHVSGLSVYPVYLLDCQWPVLFDGGVACAGAVYLEAIRSVLGERQPRILFITHVHWDHCGAVSYLKRRFPELQVAASQRAGRILERRNATEQIRRMNDGAERIVMGLPGVDASRLTSEAFETFAVDTELTDGERIELGDDITVEVLATPGHTRDHISYYVPREKILIAAEASGCLDSMGNVMTEFLADYDSYMASLERMAALPAEILCQGHRIVFVGRDEVRSFLARSLASAVRFRDRVYELLDTEAGDADRVVRRIKAEQWDANPGIKQPEAAYLLNLTAQVTHLAKRLPTNPYSKRR
jgi:2-aminobenzoylacetyl-CoA thioesterase